MKLIFIFLVHFYRLCISPFFLPTCRFHPTCSQYALEAFHKYGCIGGTRRVLSRLLRCHPWGGEGCDPLD
ncbi:MAG: membrane protein insertion efficiency factor YidD [Gemmatimonadetes bacterium]|nr:membrane protein insertion efficiency factor YidD [Gemmatimonadota bacterium]